MIRPLPEAAANERAAHDGEAEGGAISLEPKVLEPVRHLRGEEKLRHATARELLSLNA